MVCVATGIAHAQSTAGQATASFTIDANQNGLTGNSSNCYYSDPNVGTFYNSGNISITINSTETETVLYQCVTSGSSYDYIQNLVNAINAHSPFVTASVVSDNYFSVGGSIRLTAKTTGDTTNYPISMSATWDTSLFVIDPNTGQLVNAFTGPAYPTSAPGALSGGTTAGKIIYPKYQVQSIIYDAPGNHSSNGFTNSTTHGTTTSVGSSFQQGNSVTFTTGASFLGTGSTVNWTFGHSTTSGNTSADTSTITQATGVSNASGGGANAIDHKQDLFIIWLNPAVKIIQTGDTTGTFTYGTQAQGSNDPSPGQPQEQDQVEVFASSMMDNGSGQTTVPLAILVPQVVNSQHLPGLGNICANNTAYQNGTCTLANQCGCVPSDFTPILNQDPLLNFASTTSPLNANTSSAQACTNPVTSASCRYVPVMVTNGSGTQITELLAGPQQQGGNIPVNTFTQDDSTQTSETLSQSASNTVGFTINTTIASGFGPHFGFSNANTFTWSTSESIGSINGNSNSMSVSFSSSTVGCNQNIPIFEDTVFHTFVFQQPTNNQSCP
ncbi:MAG TPA: hypothetical protein VGJ51_14635 [Candidatus Angelobacter sp.]|jgi:hypothetical protein